MSTLPRPAGKPMPGPSPGLPKPGGFTSEAPAATKRNFSVSTGKMQGVGQKVCLYGPGGVGKTSLASLLKDVGMKVLFIDVEDSSKFLDVDRVTPANWDEVRQALHTPSLIAPYDVIVIESLTKLEDLAAAWVCENVQHEKGKKITSIEDYGYGKGYQHIYESFLMVLGDLDAIARTGKHIITTAHVCTENVPNPEGENWLQYQPRLQSPPKLGKVRERVKEGVDHLFFIDFDKAVSNGKAIGHGSRTIYCSERPTYWAKSRTLSDPIPFGQNDSTLWHQLFGKENV